jgi:hypothetical protein
MIAVVLCVNRAQFSGPKLDAQKLEVPSRPLERKESNWTEESTGTACRAALTLEAWRKFQLVVVDTQWLIGQ